MEIPRKIFSHWEPPYPEGMEKTVKEVREHNPEFEYSLYSDEMCRNFIKDNFDSSVLEAYDSFLPDAYKSDLWRYCILYKYGGIYLDIKFKPMNGFKFLSLLQNEYFVKDRPQHFQHGFGVYSGLLVCRPQNNVMLKCIEKVVQNAKDRVYGYNPLYPTGPGVVSEFVSKDTEFDLTFNGNSIEYKGAIILETYDDYRLEQQLFGTLHYDTAWRSKGIYRA
jgi:mannosyltransferase OCH1-like enzyme